MLASSSEISLRHRSSCSTDEASDHIKCGATSSSRQSVFIPVARLQAAGLLESVVLPAPPVRRESTVGQSRQLSSVSRRHFTESLSYLELAVKTRRRCRSVPPPRWSRLRQQLEPVRQRQQPCL